jgi:hypothetical protein
MENDGNENKKVSQDWIDDCMHFYGEVLYGKNAHWCADWDDLPIDESCDEMKYCTCFNEQLPPIDNELK